MILNEKKYVEDVIENNKLDIRKPYKFLSIYARYLYYEKNLKHQQIVDELDKYMINNYPRYRRVEWIDLFNVYANSVRKYKFCKCDGVYVTKNEISKIKELNNKVLEKVYFTLLCLAKFSYFRSEGLSQYVKLSNNEIYELANVKTTVIDQDLRLNELYVKQYVTFPKRVDNLNIKPIVIDLEIEDTSDCIFIDDFRNLGNQWLALRGDPYCKCQRCGLMVRKKYKNMKFCKSCAYINHKESVKEYKQRLKTEY